MPKKQAQILIEVIIGILIIGVAFAGSFLLISTAFKGQKGSFKRDLARSLLQENQEILRVLAIGDWFSLYDKRETGKYHLEKNNGKWEILPGEGLVKVGEENFVRYFEIFEVKDGELKSPLKVKIKTTVKWENSELSSEMILLRYQKEESWSQEDWSGGPVGGKVISWEETTSTFATSTNIHYSSSGIITLR